MSENLLLSPWMKRFLLEYLMSVRNLARNTQHSYRIRCDCYCHLSQR